MHDADDLFRELDRWSFLGRRVLFWWRDDDAAHPGPALDRLLAARASAGVPLALAVIPAPAEQALAARLSREADIAILQHGFSHRNHAGEGSRAVECGGARPLEEILAEFGRGAARLRELFPERSQPVMVPPWNRIEDRVVEALPASGFVGLSVFGPHGGERAVLREVNAHLDVLTWKGGARFAGRAKLLRLLAERLAERREGSSDEPFGLLTHHLDHDAETDDFLAELLPHLASHPALEWRSASALFAGVSR